MGAIDRILERLSRRRDVSFQREGDLLRIFPRDEHGFEVALAHTEAGWTVSFDGWLQTFASEDAAVECVAFGMSDACRLRSWHRNGQTMRWTVEARIEDEWVEGRTTGLLFFSPEAATEVRTRSNGFIRV